MDSEDNVDEGLYTRKVHIKTNANAQAGLLLGLFVSVRHQHSAYSHPHWFSFTLQVLWLSPKATCWVFPSRKSPCWAWFQTQRRSSAPYLVASPCWAPPLSTRSLWLRSRDVFHPRSASTHRSWEEFYAGQSSRDSRLLSCGSFEGVSITSLDSRRTQAHIFYTYQYLCYLLASDMN